MAKEDDKKIKEIFNAALRKESSERREFLNQMCSGNKPLRDEVESLLSSYDNAESFMETPAVAAIPEAENYQLTKGQKFEHYEVISQIGAGGMGEIYLAHDTNLNRKVALKLLPTELTGDPDRLKRFQQEAFAVSALNHPCILTIHEFGKSEDGTHFIASEYVEGETLNEYCADKDVGLEKKLDIAIQASSALSAAHEAGIIHRDIKPENIIVRPDGYIKVLDFGLAKHVEEQSKADPEAATGPMVKTDSGMVMGTAPYMSPEQARGVKVDARTDIWSLGVVLYKMLTGQKPFKGETATDTIISVVNKEPPPITAYRDDLPLELEWIVSKTLSKEVDGRYQTAKELRADLQKIKKRAEHEDEIKRSTTPDKALEEEKGESTTTIREQIPMSSQETPTIATDQRGSSAATQSSSSLEYVVTQAKRRKLLSVVGGVIVLLGQISAIGYFVFFYGNNTKQIESIAVTPFVNESGNKDLEYLADGMTDTLISSLTQIPNLSVKARSMVFEYKGKKISPKKIGEELDVEAVLLGTVVQRGDNLKLSLELVDTKTGNALWSRTYDRKISNIIPLQSEIAKNVSEKLKVRLTGEEEKKLTKTTTVNPEAYQAYLKGKFHGDKLTMDGNKKAIEFFKQAVEFDPNYALAWSSLSEFYALRSKEATPIRIRKARSAAEKAIALDPDLAEAHVSLALVMYIFDWDFAGAEKESQTAIRLNSKYATAHHWYGIFLTESGKHDEAIREAKIAVELEPLSRIINISLSIRLLFARRYEEATQQHKKTVETFPEYARGHYWLAISLAQQGKFTEAISECNKAKELGDRSYRSCLGYVYAKSGKKREAYRILAEGLKANEINEYGRALIYAMLDEKDKAFGLLEKAIQKKTRLVLRLRTEAGFDNLRDDPRYKEMVKRIGLPE